MACSQSCELLEREEDKMSSYDELAALEGRLRHCIKYKDSGKTKRCAKFSAGPGRPRGRKSAGITRRFVERSTTKKRAHKICLKRRTVKGIKKCISWRYVSAKRAVARRKGRCVKFGTRLGKRVCRKRSHTIVRKRTGKKRSIRRTPRSHRLTAGVAGFGDLGRARTKKRHCVRKGRSASGRKVCRKWS